MSFYQKSYHLPELSHKNGQLRTNGQNSYFDRSNILGTPIISAILTIVIPMLHPKIFHSKPELSK